jgi:hypothetical protein
MSRIGKGLSTLLVALILGFGAGHLFAPTPAAARTCANQICYGQGGGAYTCHATVNETNCVFDVGEMCTTEDCGGGCDPEDPECTGPPE